MEQQNEIEIVRQRLNAMGYHTMKEAFLEFQDATGWQDFYGEFWFYTANSILGRHPNLAERCSNWPSLVRLHNILSQTTRSDGTA